MPIRTISAVIDAEIIAHTKLCPFLRRHTLPSRSDGSRLQLGRGFSLEDHHFPVKENVFFPLKVEISTQ